MKIKLCDIRASDAPYSDEIYDAIIDTVENSQFILGEKVEEFEKNFAKYIGVKHCIGVSSCTAALHLALHSLSAGHVLVPTRTVTADIEAALLANMYPILYDGIPQTNEFTAAVIYVHLYGMPKARPVRFDEPFEIIEDCAQAAGASIGDVKCGTFGDISCFSFFPSKPLGCYGDGGAVCTNDDDYADKIRALRNHGRHDKHRHDLIGYNYRLDGIQAAILNVKLKYLDSAIEKRREAAKQYEKHLEGISEIKLPKEYPGYRSAYYTYTIDATNRDQLREHLANNGIQTGLHYPIPLHKQPPYAKPEYNFPEADKWAERTLSLPMYPALKEKQVKYIASKVKEFYA